LSCKHSFSSKRKPQNLSKSLYKEYTSGKQTLKQLATKYGRSIPWIKKQLDIYQPPARVIEPRAVVIVADATFFGKRKDRLGTLVFKDIIGDSIVAGKNIDTETAADYKYLLDQIKEQGFTVQAVVLDGKAGVAKVFGDIPVQMCHFHQLAIVKRYLTNNPKLEASIDLLQICRKLRRISEDRFKDALDIWYLGYKGFIEEKTPNPTTGRLTYTHAKLVSAYKSLMRNLPYLFMYKLHKNIKLPNTTNHLDGGVFSQLKKFIKLHQGLAKNRKVKFIDEFLNDYNERRNKNKKSE
jgi:hypothetical protein